jgi:hypothetical protein
VKIRTQIKAGKLSANHSDALQIRSAVKAGGLNQNHNETLQIRSALKAGGFTENHNEALQIASKNDHLELPIVPAGLRAGARDRGIRE